MVIPAHNSAAYLPEALDSVFAQGLEDLDVVVVDDGSTDGTAGVARMYGRGVRVLIQPRSGSGRARNAGLAATSGELVAFLDADDIWVPEKTSMQMRLLEADPGLALVFSDMVAFEGDRQEARTYFQQRGFDGRCAASSIFLYDMISTPTVILKRACLERVGTFDESLRIGQDTDLWFRIALELPFAVVDRALVRRRFHQGNTTRDTRELARCVVEVWGRYLERCVAREPAMRSALIKDFAHKRWDHLFQEGCALLRERKAPEARRRLSEAIGLAPLRPRPYVFYLASLLSAGSRRASSAGPAGEERSR